MRRRAWGRLRSANWPARGAARGRRRSARAEAAAFRPRAKNVIFLFMAGAPSHLELFDNKPQLAKYDGTLPPAELLKGYRAAFINPNSKLLGPEVQVRQARPMRRRAFRAAAAPGRQSSTTSPSSNRWSTDAFNHAPGQILMSTGSQQFGKPSLGAWTLYGLGSESQNLPGFVVFSTGAKGPSGGNSNWGSGFLPTVYQGVHVPHQRRPGAVSFESARRRRRAAARIARRDQRAQSPASRRSRRPGNRHADQLVRDGLPHAGQRARGDRHLAASRSTFSKCTAPSRASRRSPPRACWPGGWSSAACGSSRSSTKRGTSTATSWPTSRRTASDTDQACAALVTDLKQRGLLDDTLVIWGGEFGRTPMVQGGGNDGRDHHPNAFTMWLAGGGIKPGITLGESDELGFNVTKDRVHVHDLHATILHLLGFDPMRFSYKFQGLDQRLTGVEPARVVTEFLA